MNVGKIAQELQKALDDKNKRKTSPYDTPATVVKVDGDTLWVHIPGGVDETPVKRTIDAREGETVLVHVENGGAWATGNSSNPPTDDTVAKEAKYTAVKASEVAGNAFRHADDAAQAASEAWVWADSAHEAADEASEAAGVAVERAGVANTAANSALTQLSVVEDVVGVLNWISEHATYKASDDTEVIAGKMYFTRSDNTYTPVANPTGNPSTLGYYEIDNIDEAVSNYVSSHLALTDAGLWVVNDNSSYKILLASDGMKVYDASGNLVSTFGESIEFSSTRAQYIGGDNAYIVFNPTNGSMTIGGSQLNISGNVTIGGQTRSLSQVLADMQSEIDGSIETWYYSGVPTSSNQPAVNWTTIAQKNQHLRDLYFDTSTGHTYRWAYENSEYKWVIIEDTDATAALAEARSKVADVAVEYGVGNSSSNHDDITVWTTSPTWTEGKYIWQRTAKTINGNTTYTYSCIQGAKGETGDKGEDAVTVFIHSSNGIAFKNDSVNTTLTVYIYYGGTTITNQSGLVTAFGAGSYLQWKARLYGESTFVTIPSNDPRLSNSGFTFVLTPTDVNVQAVFNVEIIVPD